MNRINKIKIRQKTIPIKVISDKIKTTKITKLKKIF